MRRMKKYTPTKFKAKDSVYDKAKADYAVSFIECLCHTKGTWAGKPFTLIDWQEQIIRDIFGIIKSNGYRQFNTAYIEIPKKKMCIRDRHHRLVRPHMVLGALFPDHRKALAARSDCRNCGRSAYRDGRHY